MPKFDVALPVVGYAVVNGVEAVDEAAAIKKAIDEWDTEFEELNAVEKIIEGNVIQISSLIVAEATPCEDDDEVVDDDSAEEEGS
jgi:hypothetical protein